MAVTFDEMALSPTIDDPERREHVYIASGSTDQNEVETAAYAQLPAASGHLGNLKVSVIPLNPDGGRWEIRARYGLSGGSATPPPAVGESSYEFESSMVSQHITLSEETVNGYVPEGVLEMPNFFGAINVTKDGIDGCDILVPESRFSETHYLSVDVVTVEYRRRLRSLVGKVNMAPFRDHNAGEVLFIGCRGSKRWSDDVWGVQFLFDTSENRFNFYVGDIKIVRKYGWDYLWIFYEPQYLGEIIVPTPKYAYVERVYRYDDFGDLRIGE